MRSIQTTQRNILRCRWCAWTTMRFRGKRTYDNRRMSYGERRLRAHVMENHEQEYLQAQGLAAHEHIGSLWVLDENTDGPQAL